MLAGLILGAAAGLTANRLWSGSEILAWTVDTISKPAGQIWLRSLIMVVVPLVFASLTIGVAGLGDLRKLGRIGLKTLLYFLFTTALAAAIGLFLVNWLRPGEGLSEATREELMKSFGEQARQMAEKTEGGKFGVEVLVNIVPRNPVAAAAQGDMLGLIFFSLVLGAALGAMPAEKARPFLAMLEALGEAVVVIIGWVMKLAPLGVFALIFSVTALFGYGILVKLLSFVGVVLLGLALQFFGAYSILVRFLGGLRPLEFFRRIRTIALTAFSTSSSNATLPTTMAVCERELGVPRPICGFVLPLGSTLNMNGTSLFEGVAVLFIAQVFGADLSLKSQLIVLLMAVLTAVGAAGVPGGSLPLLMGVLQTVGLPPGSIALILGVDRLLDMCRTTLNVTGDVTAALYVARSEGKSLALEPAPDLRR
ncbi:MAG: dicarboxylate/amino acid:cation symporter [Planctomycetes bacterium]|nr:dicarboxylate/amino acid:cation symporter [Planctomycetota bacterium]